MTTPNPLTTEPARLTAILEAPWLSSETQPPAERADVWFARWVDGKWLAEPGEWNPILGAFYDATGLNYSPARAPWYRYRYVEPVPVIGGRNG
jgi:hypothetical protein